MILIQQLVAIVLFLVAGIFEVLRSAESLEELEEGIQHVVQQAATKVLVACLERIDERSVRFIIWTGST